MDYIHFSDDYDTIDISDMTDIHKYFIHHTTLYK